MFATMARELAEVDGVRPTLQHLVTLAVTTVPCDWAAAVMAEQITAKPAPLSASSEPELFDEVARISGKAGSSPGWDAFDSGDMVHCPDLGTETRYPAYAADMVRLTPIRSVLSVGLRRGHCQQRHGRQAADLHRRQHWRHDQRLGHDQARRHPAQHQRPRQQ